MSRHSQLEVARMADMVCAAARQAALDAVSSVLAVAADRTTDSPDQARDIANQLLVRAAIMQGEIVRFLAICRGSGVS